MNYNLRIYITDSIKDEKIIIYGYAIEVDKSEKQWSKATLLKKPKLLVLSSIMNSEELAQFCKSLEEERFAICINGEEIAIRAHFVKRPKVLIPPKEGFENESSSFINQLTITESYWNINKDDLIQKILAPYKEDNDRKRKELFNRLLNMLSEDVGMNFSDNAASKLGNVDIYTLLLSDDFFDIAVDKENNGKGLNIRKRKPIDFSLVVRCRLKNGNECILDCINEFNEQELTIVTNEPISHIEIQMWNKDKDTDQLVYMKSVGLIRQIHTSMSISGQNYKVVDPWSSELRESYAKGEKAIDSIENIRLSHNQRPSSTRGFDDDKWVEASYQGSKLIGAYIQTESKGAFCKKLSDKSGEIDSFLKILSYLCESRVTYAILVDPYFSVKAAAKLLSRISNASMTLEVITSLIDVDPDTGNKNTSLVSDVKDIIERNKGIFHKNLIVWNIVRGGNQAFHDRYLLRVFEDGATDGFLLSNSLNSAGQSYPFVIAPMEKEVTYEVKEYLRELKNSGKNNKGWKLNVGVMATELWNSDNEKFKPIIQNDYSSKKIGEVLEFITREKGDIQQLLLKAVKQGFITKDSTIEDLEIATEKKPELLIELFKAYLGPTEKTETKKLLMIIGEILYYCQNLQTQDVADYIKGSCIDKYEVIELIKEMSMQVDQESAGNIDIYDEKRKYRYGLKFEEAIDNKISYAEAIFMNTPRIYDSRIGYMHMLYRLIILLAPEKIEEILAATASPLAFGEMMDFIVCYWKEELYLKLTKSLVPSLKEISYVWLWDEFEKISDKGGNAQEFIERITELPDVNNIYQLAYVISRLTYSIINKHKNNYEDIKREYLQILSKYLECNELSENQVQPFISLLSGRQEAESSLDLLDLYKSIKGEIDIKNKLLVEVVRRLQHKLDNDESYYFSKSDWTSTQCAAHAMFYLYGVETVKYISEDFLKNKYFFTYSIPFLRDRDYGKWNVTALKSMWQLILISDLVAIDEVQGKDILVQKAISVFTDYLVPEIWQWHDRDNLVSEFILRLALWKNNGFISSDHINNVERMLTSKKTPRWVSLVFHLASGYSGEGTLERLNDIVCDSLASNELGNRRLLRLSIGELIIYRLRQEEQPEVLHVLKGIKDSYVSLWMEDNKEYDEYLNWLARMDYNDEYLQWKERAFGYGMIKNSISHDGGR